MSASVSDQVTMDDDAGAVEIEVDMEEGELSDDGMDETVPTPVGRTPIKMDLPDLLKELTGAEDFNKIDKDTMNKIAARAERFNTGNSVSFEEISKLYRSMHVTISERESIDRPEMIYAWMPDKIELADIQKFFSAYHPLNVEQVSRNSCHVVWATSANCAKAMLSLSKGIGVASTERVVKHVLDGANDEKSFVTENDVGADLIHPDDIGVEIPEDDGPWRLANTTGDDAVMLLRFGRRTDMNMRERQVAARHVGVLSKTRREELLLEQEKAIQKEQEKKKPVDKKNPWGTVAESWAIETRGRIGTDFDDYLEAYQRERKAKKDWDDPVEDDNFGKNLKTGGIRDRLGWSKKMQEEGADKDDEDMEWDTKMKKPRMGMVADIVERDSVKNRLGGGGLDFVRRKDPRRFDDQEEFQDLRQKVGVGERVIRTAGRRLNDRFSGGRLEGRLGGASERAQTRAKEEPRDNRLRSRLGDRLGSRKHDVIDIDDSDERDSLEMDMGDDLKGMELVNNMVIKVNNSDNGDLRVGDKNKYQSSDRQSRDQGRDRERDQGRDRERDQGRDRDNGNTQFDREKEIRQRLKEIKREKELIDIEKRKKHEMERSASKKVEEERVSRKRHDDDVKDSRRRPGEGPSSSFVDQIKERAKKLEKYKSKKKAAAQSSDESESDSSESEDDSESSEESSESESESSESESESESSSDSEDERQRRKKDKSKSHKSSSKGRLHEPSKSSKKAGDKKSAKSASKKELEEDLKKAAELRDQLRNYLKKAKEAKEKRKK